MIEFIDVEKYYQQKASSFHALKNINLKINQGEILGCIGYSGAGKSTLLRCVNGLEQINSGKLLVDGNELSTLSASQRRVIQSKIGIIFQQFNLLSQKTVFQNISVVLEINQYPKDKIANRVQQVLSFVGLEDKLTAYPSELSGGQKQRVGIARALANNPKILLCDEPTSALDPITTEAILELIKRVNQQLGITVLIITHEMEVISKICDKVAIMENGQIVEQGTLFDIFVTPQTKVTKQLVNNIINNQLPDVVKQKIAFASGNNIRHLIYDNDQLSKPLISYLAKQFNIDISILFGSVIEFQGSLLGSLIVEFICDETTLHLVYKELQKYQLIVKEVVL